MSDMLDWFCIGETRPTFRLFKRYSK